MKSMVAVKFKSRQETVVQKTAKEIAQIVGLLPETDGVLNLLQGRRTVT